MVLVEEGGGSVWLGCSVVGSRRGKGRDEMRWEEGGCGKRTCDDGDFAFETVTDCLVAV